MQDIEFTIREKKLYILQTVTARCAEAAVKIAVDMVRNLITCRSRRPRHLNR